MTDESRQVFEAIHPAHDLCWNELTGYASQETRLIYSGWRSCWNQRDEEIDELQADIVRLKAFEEGSARLQAGYEQACAERDLLKSYKDSTLAEVGPEPTYIDVNEKPVRTPDHALASHYKQRATHLGAKLVEVTNDGRTIASRLLRINGCSDDHELKCCLHFIGPIKTKPQPLPAEESERVRLETPKLQYHNGDFFFETFIGHFGASGGVRLTQDEVLQRVKKSLAKDGSLEWTGTELFFVPSLPLTGDEWQSMDTAPANVAVLIKRSTPSGDVECVATYERYQMATGWHVGNGAFLCKPLGWKPLKLSGERS